MAMGSSVPIRWQITVNLLHSGWVKEKPALAIAKADGWSSSHP